MSDLLDKAIFQLRQIDKSLEANMYSLKDMLLSNQGGIPNRIFNPAADSMKKQLSDSYLESVSDIIGTSRAYLESKNDYSKRSLYIYSKMRIVNDKFGRLLNSYAMIKNIEDHFGTHHEFQQVLNNMHKIVGDSVKELSLSLKTIEQPIGMHLDKIEQINLHKEAIFMSNISIACKDLAGDSLKIIESDPMLNIQLRKDLSISFSFMNTVSHKLDVMMGLASDKNFKTEDNGYFIQCYKSITIMNDIAGFVQSMENREKDSILYKFKFPQTGTESLKINLSTMKDRAINHISQLSEVIAEPLKKKKVDFCLN